MKHLPLFLPAALLATAVPARAETVIIEIDGTVTQNTDQYFMPGVPVGAPSQIRFMATRNANGSYSALGATFSAGSMGRSVVSPSFSATNGTNNDSMSFSGYMYDNYWGGIDTPTLSMSINTSGTTLQSSVLGDNLGTASWPGGVGVRVYTYMCEYTAMRIAVDSVTINATIQDRWVAGPAGDNANTGSSPSDAWATISHAAAFSSPGDTIYVLPGTYDAALGETFPVTLPDGVNLIGEMGPGTTILRGSRNEVGLRIPSASDSVVVNLRFTEFATALQIETDGQQNLLQNLAVDNCNVGIHVDGVGPTRGGHVTIEETRVESSSIGVLVTNDAALIVDLSRCLIRSCFFGYAAQSTTGAPSQNVLGQSLFFLNEVGVQALGLAEVALQDCLVAQNCDGIDANGATILVERSTVADNTGTGVDGAAAVDGSIVWGNGTDLAGVASVMDSNTGDASLAGANGNLSADPLFENPAGFDYRLSWGSPGVDAAPASVDLDGFLRPRVVDGDMNGAIGRDMGAFELRTLALAGVPVVGTTVPLELHGPPGSYGVLYVSTLSFIEPLLTPLGFWYLPQNQMIPWARVHFDANGESLLGFSIPNLPAYVGSELFLQGIIRSPASPVAIAATDFVTLIVQP